MTTATCPVYPGIQFLGDLTVAPEGPKIAAGLAAGGVRAEVPLTGTPTGPSGTGEYTILPSGPGTAHFTPLLTDIRPHDAIGVLECTDPVYIVHPERGCIGISQGVYIILRGRTGTCGFCGAHLTRICGQWLSGQVTCCGNHRQRCLSGSHKWATWIKDGELQRTPSTSYCHACGGVCTAGETAGHL
jgi:hypothetical protein